MWSLDGSAIKVGSPILTPDLNAVDGTLAPVPGTEYALAVNGVRLQAPVVDQRKDAVLYRIDGAPAAARRRPDRARERRLDDRIDRGAWGRTCVLHALRRLRRRAWARGRSTSAAAAGARTRALARPGRRPSGSAPSGSAPTSSRGSSASPRPERSTCPTAKETARRSAHRTVPWRMEITLAPTFVPREVDPVEERQPAARGSHRARRVPAAVRLGRRRDRDT